MSTHNDDEKHEKGKKTNKQKDSERMSSRFEFVPLAPEKAPKGRARYRDPANPFNTWAGIGKRPQWLRDYIEQGRELSEFEVQEK